MSNIKLDDLAPAPFFARFLEGQFSRELSAEEMKALLGGAAIMAGGCYGEPYKLPGVEELQRLAGGQWGGGAPGGPAGPCGPAGPAPVVTMAYPSDGEGTGDPF